MKNAFWLLTLLLAFKAAEASPYLSNTAGILSLNKNIVLNLGDSKTLTIPAGDHQAMANLDISYGILGLSSTKYSFVLKTQMNGREVKAKIKYEKNSDTNLVNNDLVIKYELKKSEKIISEALTEERYCTLYSFTTQENCRQVWERTCSGWLAPTVGRGKECTGEWSSSSKIVCDTVRHNIPGHRRETFLKTTITSQKVITFVEKSSQTEIGQLKESVQHFNSEKLISAEACR